MSKNCRKSAFDFGGTLTLVLVVDGAPSPVVDSAAGFDVAGVVELDAFCIARGTSDICVLAFPLKKTKKKQENNLKNS